MLPSKLNDPKLFCITADGKMQEIGATTDINFVVCEGDKELERYSCKLSLSPIEIPFEFRIKKLYRKKKGKRYLPYYKTTKATTKELLKKFGVII